MAGWFPENISTYGGDIDSVFFLIYYIVGFWFLLTEGVLLFFALRYRQRPGCRAVSNRGDTAAELTWLLVPALVVLALDLGIDVAGGHAWEKVKGKPPPGDVRVQVTAKQFNWEFTYPGPDGNFGTSDDLTLENALHVPVGKVVRLVLGSKDVVHSFFVPNLRLKQDILPGRKIEAWFSAVKPGKYEIACSELCGFGHYSMRGFLIVHSDEDYRRWIEERWPAATQKLERMAALPTGRSRR